MGEFKHISVLLDECIEGLNIRPDGIYVDATLGGGGHSFEILKHLTTGRLYGIDQDEAALAAASERLSVYGDKVHIVHSNFESIRQILADCGVYGVDGILADLGVSSYQLDEGERGFSYMKDAPLDMRMDTSSSRTAYDIVNGYEASELSRIMKRYGEEPFANNIAKHIVRYREKKPIETTLELVDVIEAAIPAKKKKKGSHPAKRTFQAIRIELNRELEVLERAMTDMIDLLNPGGRLCIITFHSLEDRIVKQAMREAENPCICPPESILCVCGRTPKGRMVSRKPILPSAEEMESNPRSRSAKLRVFEKGQSL